MATNAAFIAAIQALSVTGVTRTYTEPPTSLNTADLPSAFPLMPSGALGEKSLSCFDTNKTRTMGYVVCIEPVGQDTQASNYGKLAAVMDNMETAFDALEKSQGGTLANFIEYEMAAEIFEVSGKAYWAIVATVSARDV